MQRQAVKRYPDPSGFDGPALRAALEARFGETLTELSFALHVSHWEKSTDAEALDLAMRYAAWATLTEAGRAAHPGNTLFHVPHRIDPMHLMPVETIERDGVTMLRLPEPHWRHRDGFALTDAGMNQQQALDQMNYCIWCHAQEQGFLQQGAEGPQNRQLPEIAVRRAADRLPAGREDQRDARAARPGLGARRVRRDRGR